MRQLVQTTALGEVIVIHQCFYDSEPYRWELVCADKKGNFVAGSLHKTKQEAAIARSEMFAWHRKLKRIREKERR